MRYKFAALAAAAFSLGVMQVASAADMPVKARAYKAAPVAAISWAGLYIGVDGGWARAGYDHDFNINGHYNNAAGDTFDYSKSGAILGGHIGYNWQFSQWVLGVEGGFAKSWLNADEVVSPFFPTSDRFSSSVKWIGTVTPRVGFAAGSFLIYGKGGWAVTRLTEYIHDTSDFVDFKTTRSGWTLGAGVEYMVMPNWILGVEYNHYDFGSANVNMASTNFAGGTFFPGTDHDLKVTVDAVQGRISYKFGSVGP
jgi:outer membrane immunogenic protein